MNKKLRKLLGLKAALVTESEGLSADIEALEDKAELTDDEQSQLKTASSRFGAILGEDGEIAKINTQIDRETRLAAERRSLGGIPLEDTDDTDIHVGEDRATQDPKGGFASFGQYLLDVYHAGLPNGSQSERLVAFQAAAPTTFSQTGVGADGGFAVPIEFGREIERLVLTEEALLPLTRQYTIAGNSIKLPRSETTPWGSTGIQAYWTGEGAAITESKIALERSELALHKLTALTPVTEELLADAQALGSYLGLETSDVFRWKINDALINGSGVGLPKGVANAAALVAQAKVSGQSADTINATNVLKMFGRHHRRDLGSSRWLICPDGFNQLPAMTIGNEAIYFPPGARTLQNAPGGLLLGIPVILSDTCQKLGDQGDIYLVDFSFINSINKGQGVDIATSMHFYFDADTMAFRAIYRLDAKPAIDTAITPPNRSEDRSPFMTLAVRA